MTRPAATAVAVCVVATTGVWLGCDASDRRTSTPAEDETRTAAPSLVLSTVDGTGTVSLQEQRGKVVLVDLWATWCVPCIAELPRLQALSERFGPDEFMMLGIVLESGEREEVQAFITEQKVDYPQVMGEPDTGEAFGPFLAYPTKHLIDRDGFVVKSYVGIVGDEVAADVETLIRTGTLPEDSAD